MVYFFLVLFFLVEVFFLVEKVFLLNNNLIFWLSFWICNICLCNCLSWECICLMDSVRVSTDFSCFCSGWTICPILLIWVVCFSSKLEMVASLIAFGVVEGFLAVSPFSCCCCSTSVSWPSAVAGCSCCSTSVYFLLPFAFIFTFPTFLAGFLNEQDLGLMTFQWTWRL